jgi:hypothetical protein
LEYDLNGIVPEEVVPLYAFKFRVSEFAVIFPTGTSASVLAEDSFLRSKSTIYWEMSVT